ncbi:MAG: DinB family protein, partial [Acidimicrobiales bacterium]
WMDRTRLILEHGTSGVFEPIDREGGFGRFGGWTLGALLERFAMRRAANLAELDEVLRAGDLDRSSTHPDFGTVTLGELLATWVVHDFNHVGQIVKTMGKQYADAVGPWRAYLPIIDAP